MTLAEVRYLLLQVRNQDDPMRSQEVACFRRALECDAGQIETFDLIGGAPTMSLVDQFDVVLLGGSGDYSVAEGGPWLPEALEAMRLLVNGGKPTFASCWGFQAMAAAGGGAVVTDLERAELGTHRVRLTEAGAADPVFAPLGETFHAQMGHQDIVEKLPDDAVLLASTDIVRHQAFRIAGKPIYCTQFHPELTRADLLQRLEAYPQYIERIAGMTPQRFFDSCFEAPEANRLLLRFVRWALDIDQSSVAT